MFCFLCIIWPALLVAGSCARAAVPVAVFVFAGVESAFFNDESSAGAGQLCFFAGVCWSCVAELWLAVVLQCSLCALHDALLFVAVQCLCIL